jgi:hypothetical protein
MIDIVFLNDAVMAREAFEQLPALAGDAASLVTTAQRKGGQLFRAPIERNGRHEWHALAWLYINGTERITAARVKFGRYQSED